MTDDQTRPIEPMRPTEPIPADAAPATEAPTTASAWPARVEDATPASPTDTSSAGAVAAGTPDAATDEAAPAGAVAPVATGSNRGRWLLALGLAGLAIAITVVALLVLNGPATPEALRYVPADAAFVAEVRLDLPGDQMQHLGNLLAHFPGFKDQASLPDKIDEALTRLIGTASGGQANFRSDLKPWLNGAAFVGVLAPASGATAQKPQAVISATTNGSVSCAATFKDQTVSHESYRGLDLVLSADGSMACVVDGRQALLGDPATVKKALDAKATGTGMDKVEKYRAARAALGGDRLATLFVSGSSVAQMLPLPAASAAIPDLTAVVSAIPEWIMVGLRAEDDALVVDTIAAPVALPSSAPSLLPLPSTHPSLINGLVPADTLVLFEHQGAGISLQNLLTVLRANPQLAAPLQMLDGLGGGGDLFGWIDDVGVAASIHGTKPDVAMLIVARDDAAASSRVAALGTLLGLAGLGDGVQVSASTISGVAVTTIRITDLASVVPPGSVPGIDQLPVTGPIEFSIAARGRVILLASGEAAMTAILNVQPGASLADQPSFKLAVQRGLANSRTSVYLAAGASFDLAKTLLPAATVAQWQSDIAPYVDPIDAIGLSISGDAAAYRSRLVITVSQP